MKLPENPDPQDAATPAVNAERMEGVASVGAGVAAAIDRVVQGPVLVVGSPPPGGRDLDLLATPQDRGRIEAWLTKAGFTAWRHTWVRFDDALGYAVELSSTEPWQTASDDASSLFAGAQPLSGLHNLMTPDPGTWLLLAARGTVTRRGRVTEKVRRRVARALDADPNAWEAAAERAADLGMLGALELLRRACDAEGSLPLPVRAAGLARVLAGPGPWRAKQRLLTGARPRRLRPAIIAFAGLDGAGKSTQADLLHERLRELGVSSERRWAGFKTAKQLRARLPVLDRQDVVPDQPVPQRDRVLPAALSGHHAGEQAWVYAVVAVNVFHLWRTVLRRRPGTELLVFDRFTVDAAVKLELHFPRTRNIDIAPQRWLFERLSPKPDVVFWVDVPAEVALGRRPEEIAERLATMRELYGELASRYRAERLDGTEAFHVLARCVARAAWRGLP